MGVELGDELIALLLVLGGVGEGCGGIVPTGLVGLKEAVVQVHDGLVFAVSLEIIGVPSADGSGEEARSLEGTGEAACAAAVHTEDRYSDVRAAHGLASDH